MSNKMYSDSDWEADTSPLRGLVADESSFVLSAEEAKFWYLVRVELLCLDAGKVVLRPGRALLSNHRPLQFNSTVILSHRRTPAVGSICAMSEDRRFLEEQLKILEEQVNGRAQPGADHTNNGVGGLYSEGTGVEGSPEEGAGDYSHSGTDWDPDTHTSTDSELETSKRRCLAKQGKREYPGSKKSKPRGPSLRAELTQKRHSTGMRSYSRVSKESQPSSYKFNTLRASDFQSFAPQVQPKQEPPAAATMTFDQQSQTEASSDDVHALKAVVGSLQEEVNRMSHIITDMQAKMQHMQSTMGINPDIFDMKYDVREEVIASDSHVQRSTPTISSSAPRPRGNVLAEMNRSGLQQRMRRHFGSGHHEENTSNSYGSDAESEYSADMVPIGSGKTLVPRAIYTQINWHSYTIATRKLLMAVFPRRTLATHSLTGKASPAFTSKPAKLRLDMKKVTDIVMTVADNCGVREGLVRSCITTKCADENKMYRMRLEKKAKKAKKSVDEDSNNQENTPPQASRKSDIDQEYLATPVGVPRQV